MAENDLFGEIEPTWRMAVSAELFRIEDTCSRAARGQAETVKIWRVVNTWLGSLSILTAGVAGSLVLANGRLPMVAGGLALVSAMLTTVVCVVGPARRETQAAEASKAYHGVETVARQARLVDLPTHTFGQARQTLTELTERWQSAQRGAIPTLRIAQRRAERGTFPEKVDNEMTERMSDVVRVFQMSH